ncbi:MAG TPA: DinB family protein [Terriglobia bacterium]|nr:DinB family protein [Terriglobia bacterium]
MKISDMLLPEFDQEMANTRKTLERIPDDKFGWKPHEKSMPLGRLAAHLAEMPGWAVMGIEQDSLDLAPPSGPAPQPTIANSRQEVLDLFDKNKNEARAAIAKASDEHLVKNWSLLRGGQTLMTLPRTGVLRGFVMNHMIHHRAQLGVYLRLNNIPVPSIYGPSADEGQLGQ